jgi:RNA polymerase sigma-70 factor (ECF subfamily)
MGMSFFRNSDDAADFCQDVFIKAFKSLGLFEGRSRFSTWLYKIAANESITFLNKQKAQASLSIDDEEVFLENKLAADEYFDGNDLQMQLQKAIATLPTKQRQVFNLRYYDELPYEDISKIMATSVGSLKASYHHAVKKIEDFFNKQ